MDFDEETVEQIREYWFGGGFRRHTKLSERLQCATDDINFLLGMLSSAEVEINILIENRLFTAKLIKDAQEYMTDAHSSELRSITPLQALQELASYYEGLLDKEEEQHV